MIAVGFESVTFLTFGLPSQIQLSSPRESRFHEKKKTKRMKTIGAPASQTRPRRT